MEDAFVAVVSLALLAPFVEDDLDTLIAVVQEAGGHWGAIDEELGDECAFAEDALAARKVSAISFHAHLMSRTTSNPIPKPHHPLFDRMILNVAWRLLLLPDGLLTGRAGG